MHKIHAELPSGFAFANQQQIDQYDDTGFIAGAAKVCFVREAGEPSRLAVRLRPPRTLGEVRRRQLIRLTLEEYDVWDDTAVEWYHAQYDLGWSAGKRSGDSAAWESGVTSHAWDDGYLDAAAGRPKWHLAHCVDHDSCGEA